MENTTEENSAASGGDGSRSSLKTNHDAMGMRDEEHIEERSRGWC